MNQWHIITCEYPPQVGGVSDYTQVVAAALADAGDEVHVWCPGNDPESSSVLSNVVVHRRLGRFGASDLERASTLLDHFPSPRHLLVQWVPHGYGQRAMNLRLCWWLLRRAARHGDRLDLMVHEAYLPFYRTTRQAVIAAMQRVMTIVLLSAAHRVWVSVPAWKRRLRPYAWRRRLDVRWLPIPSVLMKTDCSAMIDVRERYHIGDRPIVGHFGTYSEAIANQLQVVLPALIDGIPRATALLIGAGSVQLRERLCARHPHLSSYIHATGVLPANAVAGHLTACDLLIQPYPDGVSSRRTTVMTPLALAVPILTTRGMLTERLWDQAQAVSLCAVNDSTGMIEQAHALIADADARKRLGAAGRDLYLRRFDVRHTVAALRN